MAWPIRWERATAKRSDGKIALARSDGKIALPDRSSINTCGFPIIQLHEVLATDAHEGSTCFRDNARSTSIHFYHGNLSANNSRVLGSLTVAMRVRRRPWIGSVESALSKVPHAQKQFRIRPFENENTIQYIPCKPHAMNTM